MAIRHGAVSEWGPSGPVSCQMWGWHPEGLTGDTAAPSPLRWGQAPFQGLQGLSRLSGFVTHALHQPGCPRTAEHSNGVAVKYASEACRKLFSVSRALSTSNSVLHLLFGILWENYKINCPKFYGSSVYCAMPI